MARSSTNLREQAASYLLILEDPEATEREVLEAVAWLEANPDHFSMLSDTAHISEICDDIRDFGLADFPKRQRQFRLPLRGWMPQSIFRMAAGIVLAFLATSLFLVAVQFGAFDRAAQTGLDEQYATRIGESLEIALPDRTRVRLGGASEINVHFESDVRRVTLTQGEAYFDVAKDHSRPFVVSPGRGLISALGTEFNVHKTLDGTVVTLIEGRVKVVSSEDENGPNAELGPHTQVKITSAGGLSEIKKIDAPTVLSWQNGSYIYDDVPLKLIVADLARYSQRKIVVQSAALNEMHFTGVVELDDNEIEHWLSSLAYLGGIRVSIKGNVISISEAQNSGGL